MSRKRIFLKVSEQVQHEVLQESAFRCAVPTCRAIFVPGVDELTRIEEFGKNEAPNLVALCASCRKKAGSEALTTEALSIYKKVIAALHKAFDREAVDQLLLLDSEEFETLQVSGDGVLRLSGAISAGLMSYESFQQGYRLMLTEKGRSFVQDWKNGVTPALLSAPES